MSIRPIDLQVLLGKMQEVAKNQQNQEHAPIVAQQVAAAQSLKESERQTTQVQQTPRAEGGKVEDGRKKREKEQPEGEEKRRGKRDTSKKKEALKDPVRGNVIDIEL